MDDSQHRLSPSESGDSRPSLSSRGSAERGRPMPSDRSGGAAPRQREGADWVRDAITRTYK